MVLAVELLLRGRWITDHARCNLLLDGPERSRAKCWHGCQGCKLNQITMLEEERQSSLNETAGSLVGIITRRPWWILLPFCFIATITFLSFPSNKAGTSFNNGNCCSLTGSAQTVTVNWSNVQQTIDGFGGSVVGFVSAMDPSVANAFFRTDIGIGLSIVRLQIIPSVADCTPAVVGGLTANCVATSGATILDGELANAHQAQARGVSTFFASSWSPDGPYKTGGVWWAGGSLIGTPSNYAAIASNMASYATLLNANGIHLYVFSLQNEPDINVSYASCLWTAQQFHDFIPYVKSAFASVGMSSTKIMIPESSQWYFAKFSEAALADPKVNADIDIIAAHGYASPNPKGPPTITGLNGQHVWMTEVSSQSSTYDGGMSDALGWAAKIHSYLANAHVNAWIWWFLSDQPCCGNGSDNGALTDINGNFPQRMWVTGNWSRFVRPGWHEVGVGKAGDLLVTAFQDPINSHSVIVAVNSGSSPVGQVFRVGAGMGSSVVPYLTSRSSHLAVQSPLVISGGSFTYTLPASSVTTFVSN